MNAQRYLAGPGVPGRPHVTGVRAPAWPLGLHERPRASHIRVVWCCSLTVTVVLEAIKDAQCRDGW